MSLFGLKKTREGLWGRVASLFGRKLDEEFYEELEEALILADVGVETSVELVERLRDAVREQKINDTERAKQVMIDLLSEMMDKGTPDYEYPLLILMVGVNGVGKTTAIGRLANQFQKEGKKVLLAAGDTFRAAAAEQLAQWAERTQSQFVGRALRVEILLRWCLMRSPPPRHGIVMWFCAIQREDCITEKTSWMNWVRCAR